MSQHSLSPSESKKLVQWLGLVSGPLMAILCLALLPAKYESRTGETQIANITSTPDSVATEASDQTEPTSVAARTSREFTWAGRATLAVMIWMGIWWMSEAIEIAATALLPIVVFPLLGIAEIKDATAPYAHHLIFLYFGGFVIALSMERWLLGKRIALLTLGWIGTTAPQMVAGFMIVTAVLSAFVSNTATTAMMLPIALSTIALLHSNLAGEQHEAAIRRFSTCLLLGVAYSASVGGIMTIIGTPPNVFLIGFLKDDIASAYRYDFSFVGWLPIGLSVTLVFLPIVYVALTRFLFPIRDVRLAGGEKMIRSELEELGRVSRGEWITLIVFCCTVLLWLTRPILTEIRLPGFGSLQPFQGWTDTGIAMTAALALFLIPVDWKERQFTMDWKTTNKMPWGILILFGGGLSLASAVKANGVAEFIGSYTGQIGSMPTVLAILFVTAAIVFLTELTSNLATTTSLVPVLAAVAPGVGIHPFLLILPATIAASCAFMLPVATPPNAIVFGSGRIELPDMMRAGITLNLLSIALVTLLTIFVIQPWLGLPSGAP